MNIVVCIKEVPDTTEVKIDSETNTLKRSGVECIINPYDLHAIEEGLRIKEKFDGRLTVISMGPPQVKKSLKKAISLGVDETILLSDRAFAGADTLATSYTLAQAIKKIGDIDLILCGKQAIDGDTGQVGPGIAEHLNIPHSTYINDVQADQNSITVQREFENGHETIELQLPALLTLNKEINEPRLPSIRGILRSREIEIPVWTKDDLDVNEDLLGLDGSPTQVIWVGTPELNKEGDIYTGKPKEQAEKLVDELSDLQIF